MTPEQAKTIADFLASDFEYEIQATMRVLEAVPSGKQNYSPDAKSKTGLGLVRHLVLEDEWLLNSIADGVFNMPPDDSDACGIMNGSDGVARYKTQVPAALNRVRALSGEQLLKVIDLLGLVQMPAVNFLSLAMKHSVHHRGQLSSYLRAMGGSVPGIYGPSADTQQGAAA